MSTPSREDLEAFVRTTSALLGLTIDTAYAPAVIDHLELIFKHHGLVSGQSLPIDIEAAFVFRP